jgi:hypothetical protein
MKFALLFLTIGCATLLCSTAHATDDTNPKQKASQAAAPTNHRAAVAKPGHGSVPLPKPVTPHGLANKAKKPGAGKSINAHHSVFGQRNNPTNTTLNGSRNTIQPHALTPSTPARPNALTPNNARHHGPNPAVIGGPKNSATAGTGALNGTALHRSPGGIAR